MILGPFEAGHIGTARFFLLHQGRYLQSTLSPPTDHHKVDGQSCIVSDAREWCNSASAALGSRALGLYYLSLCCRTWPPSQQVNILSIKPQVYMSCNIAVVTRIIKSAFMARVLRSWHLLPFSPPPTPAAPQPPVTPLPPHHQ